MKLKGKISSGKIVLDVDDDRDITMLEARPEYIQFVKPPDPVWTTPHQLFFPRPGVDVPYEYAKWLYVDVNQIPTDGNVTVTVGPAAETFGKVQVQPNTWTLVKFDNDGAHLIIAADPVSP